GPGASHEIARVAPRPPSFESRSQASPLLLDGRPRALGGSAIRENCTGCARGDRAGYSILAGPQESRTPRNVKALVINGYFGGMESWPRGVKPSGGGYRSSQGRLLRARRPAAPPGSSR